MFERCFWVFRDYFAPSSGSRRPPGLVSSDSRNSTQSCFLHWEIPVVVLMHGLAQSLITTYAGPQLPVTGNPALNQVIDHPYTEGYARVNEI
jgi:hypothetical protein